MLNIFSPEFKFHSQVISLFCLSLQQKSKLRDSIDTYVRDQIDKAAEAISQTVQEKISDGDVILTFGCSSVILNILNEAKKSKRDFRVIVVDARPWHEGQEMLRRLVAKNIKCTCVLINAAGFIMPEVLMQKKRKKGVNISINLFLSNFVGDQSFTRSTRIISKRLCYVSSWNGSNRFNR